MGAIAINDTKMTAFSQTANGKLSDGFANCEAISHPLQNPIKNIICSPE
jgi:hypothetical protein